MNVRNRPSRLAGNLAMAAAVLVWGAVRLWIFHDHQIPLTFVLPLLVCVWTRRRWHLVAMAVAFVLMTTAKYLWILPAEVRAGHEALWNYGITLFNIVAGAVVVELILRLRDGLDARADAILQQNGELEAQAEELAQQNEAIKTQTEELAQQNEEIEAQSEELQRQNEELLDANQRLGSREEILQAVVESARQASGGATTLARLCERVLPAIGGPTELLALVEADGPAVQLRAQAPAGGDADLPPRWDRAGSLAGLVLEQNRTAYVDDLQCRPDLAAPFGPAGRYRSLLAAPVSIAGKPSGVLLAASSAPGHWTLDQFRLVEWAAAQCGWIMDALRWQAALLERAETVEAAGRAKDEFLATLSHELRTPLSPVLVAAEELAEDVQLPAEARQQLEMIRRNVAVQSRLIDDLLDLTRIARGKLDLDQQPVDVRTLLQEAVGVVTSDISAKGQTLRVEIDLPLRCEVVGDAARLQQVFWNLLKNSTKFSPRGATIVLRAAVPPSGDAGAAGGADGGRGAAGRRVFIEVVDSGPGIAPEDLQRIFRPFEQATSARRRGSGLGLGLSIARAIVEMHDGKIEARSAGLGAGAAFKVELPLAPALEAPAPAAAGEPPRQQLPPRVSACRILLVEDHADTGAAMLRVLRRAGYTVEHAPSLAAGVEAWHRGRFDLLISDLGLPDGTGLDLLRRLRVDGGGAIRAICMSGYGMESDLAASREAGFHDHLIKPVSRQKLFAAIEKLFERTLAADGPATPV